MGSLLVYFTAVKLRSHIVSLVSSSVSVLVGLVRSFVFVGVMSAPRSVLIFPILLFLSQVTLCDGPLIRPKLGIREWKLHDAAVKTRLQPIHSALSADAITPSEAAAEFSYTLADFLGSVRVFKAGEGGSGGERGGDTDISDEAFLAAKREKKRLQRLVYGRTQLSSTRLLRKCPLSREPVKKRERERDTRTGEWL